MPPAASRINLDAVRWSLFAKVIAGSPQCSAESQQAGAEISLGALGAFEHGVLRFFGILANLLDNLVASVMKRLGRRLLSLLELLAYFVSSRIQSRLWPVWAFELS